MRKKNNFARSVLFALHGLMFLFRKERNARIQLSVAILAISGGILLRISRTEWLIIILCVGMVFTAEALNTSIEKLTDLLHPGWDEKAGRVKDLAASAVFIISVTSAIIGLLVFAPKLIAILN